jgi:hypothetical protein
MILYWHSGNQNIEWVIIVQLQVTKRKNMFLVDQMIMMPLN